MLAYLKGDASVVPQLLPRVELFAAQIQARLGKKLLAQWPRQMAPVLTTRFATPHGEGFAAVDGCATRADFYKPTGL